MTPRGRGVGYQDLPPHVEIDKKANGTVYYRYLLPNGQRKSLGKDKTEAIQAAQALKKVLAVLGKIECPYLQHEISSVDCQKYKDRDAPTQNPAEMRHWRACQSCSVGCNKRRSGDV